MASAAIRFCTFFEKPHGVLPLKDRLRIYMSFKQLFIADERVLTLQGSDSCLGASLELPRLVQENVWFL